MPSMGTGRYIGGLPDQYREVVGHVWATEKGIGIGDTGPTDLVIPLVDVRLVDLETVAVAKSKVPAALAFGVLGALTARGSENKVAVTVHLHSGVIAYFRIDVLELPFVRGLVGPWLAEHGLDGKPRATSNLIDQLERLAALRSSGALTEDEFARAKEKLLA